MLSPLPVCQQLGSLNPGVTHVSSSYGKGPSGIQYLVLGICPSEEVSSVGDKCRGGLVRWSGEWRAFLWEEIKVPWLVWLYR